MDKLQMMLAGYKVTYPVDRNSSNLISKYLADVKAERKARCIKEFKSCFSEFSDTRAWNNVTRKYFLDSSNGDFNMENLQKFRLEFNNRLLELNASDLSFLTYAIKSNNEITILNSLNQIQ